MFNWKRLFIPGINFTAQRGSILLSTLFIVIFLGALGAIVATMIVAEIKSQIFYTEERKAFYAAESALQLSLASLTNGGDGILSDVNIGGAVVNTTLEGDTLLTATAATTHGLSQLQVLLQLQDTDSMPSPFYYLVSAFDDDEKLYFKGPHHAYLKGEIFTYSTDKVKFYKHLTLDNVTLHVPEETKVHNHSGYALSIERFPGDEMPLEWPSLKTEYYDNYIYNVYGYEEYDEEEIEDDLDLTTLPDGVLYSDDELEIEDGCTITGPGMIVAKKEIEIEDKVTIGPNVKIIAGKEIKLGDGAVLTGMESILYASKEIKIEGEHTSVSGSIITPDEIKIDGDKKLSDRGIITGLVYAGKEIKIEYARIHGTIISKEVKSIDSSYLKWDPKYLPSTLPPGFTPPSGSGSIRVVKRSWKVLK